MFSSLDKAITSFLGAGVAYLVGTGALTAEEGVSLAAVGTSLIAAVVAAIVTYVVPNK